MKLYKALQTKILSTDSREFLFKEGEIYSESIFTEKFPNFFELLKEELLFETNTKNNNEETKTENSQISTENNNEEVKTEKSRKSKK